MYCDLWSSLLMINKQSPEILRNALNQSMSKSPTSKKKIRQTAAEGISSIMTKVEMAKYIHLQMWKLFIICKCDFFSIWGANSIETNLQTCNLPIGQSISYKSFRLKAVSIEFAPSNGKNVSHLQNTYFLPFRLF